MTKDDYLKLLSEASKTKADEVILACLDYYGVHSTAELTLEQVKEYWEEEV